MKLFQSTSLYPSYIRRLDRLAASAQSFRERQEIFLADRHGAVHFLKPVLDRDVSAFQASTNDHILQRMWADEHGLPQSLSLDEILIAQIEEHQTEVFYNMDPVRFPSAFLRKLPGCVRKTIAWRAAPTKDADFTAYDLVVCNFPSLLEQYRLAGCRVAWFSPAHDPVMDRYAQNGPRPIDLIFIGGFTRHHKRRAQLLEAAADMSGEFRIEMHLDSSRMTRLVDSRPWCWLPFIPHKTPQIIRKVATEPLFGVDLYGAMASAKIVLNGAIDMAGADKGNVRCFESMGCGCVMLSDEGNYPPGMQPQVNFVTYKDPVDAIAQARSLLANPDRITTIGNLAHTQISQTYTKERQFETFCRLVG